MPRAPKAEIEATPAKATPARKAKRRAAPRKAAGGQAEALAAALDWYRSLPYVKGKHARLMRDALGGPDRDWHATGLIRRHEWAQGRRDLTPLAPRVTAAPEPHPVHDYWGWPNMGAWEAAQRTAPAITAPRGTAEHDRQHAAHAAHLAARRAQAIEEAEGLRAAA